MTNADDTLRQLLDSSDLPWWEWDIPTNRVTFNDLKVTMIGYRAEDFRDVGYQAFTELLHPEDYEPALQAMRDHLEGRAPRYQIDYRIKAADGHYEWYMDRGIITERAGDGSPLRLRGIVIDLGRQIGVDGEYEALLGLLRKALPTGRDPRSLILCANCRSLKLADDRWVDAGDELATLVGAPVSHGICPRCMRRLYPEHADQIGRELPALGGKVEERGDGD